MIIATLALSSHSYTLLPQLKFGACLHPARTKAKKIARKVPGLLGKRDLGALVFKYSSLVCAGFCIKLGKMEPTIRSAV